MPLPPRASVGDELLANASSECPREEVAQLHAILAQCVPPQYLAGDASPAAGSSAAQLSAVTTANAFQRVANELMSHYLLVARPQKGSPCYYAMQDLEFYLVAPAHHDPYAHAHPSQRATGNWYLHRAGRGPGAGYREGTYKGLDLTFGRSASGYLTAIGKERRHTTGSAQSTAPTPANGKSNGSQPKEDSSADSRISEKSPGEDAAGDGTGTGKGKGKAKEVDDNDDEEGDIFGGILIRRIRNVQTGDVHEGPCVVIEALFQQLGNGKLRSAFELAQLLHECSNVPFPSGLPSATEGPLTVRRASTSVVRNELRASCSLGRIWPAPRNGLTLKRGLPPRMIIGATGQPIEHPKAWKELEARLNFILKPYRFLSIAPNKGAIGLWASILAAQWTPAVRPLANGQLDTNGNAETGTSDDASADEHEAQRMLELIDAAVQERTLLEQVKVSGTDAATELGRNIMTDGTARKSKSKRKIVSDSEALARRRAKRRKMSHDPETFVASAGPSVAARAFVKRLLAALREAHSAKRSESTPGGAPPVGGEIPNFADPSLLAGASFAGAALRAPEEVARFVAMLFWNVDVDPDECEGEGGRVGEGKVANKGKGLARLYQALESERVRALEAEAESLSGR